MARGGQAEDETMGALDFRNLGGEDGGGERRLFECKTCGRRFATFQALGGHRTSHGRPRCGGNQAAQLQRQMLKMKPRLHACPVCGLAFPMGQALGGHMRRHRAPAAETTVDHLVEFTGGAAAAASRKLRWLDLNLPPLEDELRLCRVGAFDESGEEMIRGSPSSSSADNYLSAACSSYSA